MDRPMHFKIGIGVALALIVLITPAAALRAEKAAKPMMSHDFTDVPVAGQEFMEPFIDAFYHQGITNGCSVSPLQYCPTNPVTRGSMAVFIGRALGYVDMETDGYDARAYFKQTGEASSDNGVIASSIFGTGVWGMSTDGVGIHAQSGSSYGMFAQSTSSYAVIGTSLSGIGVGGGSDTNYGVTATSGSYTALAANSFTEGLNDSVYDVFLGGTNGEMFGNSLNFFSDSGFVFELDNNSDGLDTFTILDHDDNVIFAVTELGNMMATGSKSAIVDTVSYGTRAMYAVEATEVLFEEVGSAELVDGEAVITIDPMFAETVNLEEGYQVFLTPVGELATLYIAEKTDAYFIVRADTTADLSFDYRIVAKRLGYEDVRMEEVNP